MARKRNRMGDTQKVAAKWAANLAGAQQAIKDGVMGVQVSPCASAADKVNEYVQGVVASADIWERKMRAVTLQDWQRAMIDFGVPKIAIGVKKGQPKYQAHMQRWNAYFSGPIQSALDQMPRGNLQQNIARMTTVVTMASQFRQNTQ